MVGTRQWPPAERAVTTNAWIRVLVNGLLVALSAFFFARCVVSINHRLHAECAIFCSYIGPQYYFSYDHGFIRRGLPGAVLQLFGGPPRVSFDAVGWGLACASVAAVVLLALMMFWELRAKPLRYAATALVLLCPLSISLFVLDPGRYDAVGFVGLAAVALLGASASGSRRPLRVGGVATVVMLIVVLSEEFLFLFMLAPVLLLMLRHADRGSRRRRMLTCSAPFVFPLAVAAASSVVRPSQAQVDAAQVASGRAPGSIDAALFMRTSISGEYRFVAGYGLEPFIHAMLIWFSVFTLAVLILAVAYGVQGRWYWYAAAGNALAALAISVIGADQRRWWALAFISQVTALVVYSTRRSDARRADGSASIPVNLLLLASLGVLAFVLVPQMFLVVRHERLRYLVTSGVGLLIVCAAVALARRWSTLHLPQRAAATTLPLVASLVVVLGTLFVTASWYYVPVDFWRQASTWSSISSYWFSWV
jgi:hypothetical protein